MAEKFTASELAECAEREVRQRQRVYGRLVSVGKMTSAHASKERAMMQQIADEYRERAQAEKLL